MFTILSRRRPSGSQPDITLRPTRFKYLIWPCRVENNNVHALGYTAPRFVVNHCEVERRITRLHCRLVRLYSALRIARLMTSYSRFTNGAYMKQTHMLTLYNPQHPLKYSKDSQLPHASHHAYIHRPVGPLSLFCGGFPFHCDEQRMRRREHLLLRTRAVQRQRLRL